MAQIVIGAVVPNESISDTETVRVTIKSEFRHLYRGKVKLASGRDVADIEGLHVRGHDLTSFEVGFLLNIGQSLPVAFEHADVVVMKPIIPILGTPRESSKFAVVRD